MADRLDVEKATMLVTVETVYAVPMADFAVEQWTESALRKGRQHDHAQNCYVTAIRAAVVPPDQAGPRHD